MGNEEKFKKLAEALTAEARRLFENSRAYVAANGAEKDKILVELRDRVSQANKELNTAHDGSNDANKRQALETAVATYAEMLHKLEGVHGAQVTEKRFIDIHEARQLGSIAQIIPILIERWKEVSTWMYVILALSLDVILIVCFMRVLRGRAMRSSGQAAGKPTERDLSFLWVNP